MVSALVIRFGTDGAERGTTDRPSGPPPSYGLCWAVVSRCPWPG